LLVGRLGRRDLLAPSAQHVLDTLAYLASSCFAVDARHQQLVIVGVDVPDRRCNGEVYGVRIEGPPRRASSDPATAARCRMTRHRVGPAGRTAREQLADRGGELGLEPHVFVGPPRRVALPAAVAGLSIG
jgi:hypothetical protein